MVGRLVLSGANLSRDRVDCPEPSISLGVASATANNDGLLFVRSGPLTADRRSSVDWLRTLLETSPMTTLFLVIALGYLVGEINFKGFALGSGAVLFVGLACGAFAPKAAPPGMLGTLGLLLFLYCVGIQYGSEWYRGLTSPSGLRANAAALCGLLAAAAVTLVIHRIGAADLPESLGMFAGASTSTPALQAVLDALGNQEAAVGYSLVVPAWRRRADPLDVPLSRDLQTEDCACGGPADEAGRGPGEQSDARRTAIRGSSADPAERHPGGGDSQRRSEPRPGSGGRSPGGRCAPARRDRSRGNCRGARVSGRRGLVHRDGSNGTRLHSRLRIEDQHRGNAPRQPEASRRLRLQLHPRATG